MIPASRPAVQKQTFLPIFPNDSDSTVWESVMVFTWSSPPFLLDEIEPAHLGVEGKGHVGEGLGVRDAHLLVVLDIFLSHIHVGTVVDTAAGASPWSSLMNWSWM